MIAGLTSSEVAGEHPSPKKKTRKINGNKSPGKKKKKRERSGGLKGEAEI